MKKIFVIIFLFALFHYINLSCNEASDDGNVSKDACLKRKPEGLEATKIGDYTPDTCCYVESSVKCDDKKTTYKMCQAYDKKNLKKYLEYIEELSKNIQVSTDDNKCKSSDPDINCSSYYLKLGFAILLFLF